MATQAQILANQASAQHFTGPKSAGGKASSSRNNLRDGLTVASSSSTKPAASAFADPKPKRWLK